MPLNRDWIDQAVQDPSGDDVAIARLAIVLAKASYRVTEKMVTEVLGEPQDEKRFIRILARSSFTAARRVAQLIAEKVEKVSIRAMAAIAA